MMLAPVFVLRSLVAFAVLSLVIAQDTSLGEVKNAFDNAKIPADAHLTFKPTTLLEVTFAETAAPPVHLFAGRQLKRNQTAIPPVFAVQSPTRHQLGEMFVMAMVDLDAPTPQTPTSAQIRHFLGGNFRLSQPSPQGPTVLTNSTPALTEFHQPTPPAGSDPHRYVFLLFEQPADFNTQTEVTPATSIANFNISQFALDVGLGNALGGTFMLVGPDPTA